MHKTKAAIAGILALFAVASASAQQFPTVPDHTVIGRIGVGGSSGPSQAIPFSSFLPNVVGPQAINTVFAGPASGAAAFPSFRLLIPNDLPFGTPTNTRSAYTSVNSLATTDCRKTVALGGSAFYAFTVGAASGFNAGCQVTIVNEDSICPALGAATCRGKAIAINGYSAFILWPGQQFNLVNQNNVWQYEQPGRWIAPTNLQFNVNHASGLNPLAATPLTDCLGSGTGACNTIQNAVLILESYVDCNNFGPVIQNVAETFTENNVSHTHPLTGYHVFSLNGNTGTPSSVVWQVSGSGNIGFQARDTGMAIVTGFKFVSTGTGNFFLQAGQLGIADFGSIEFGGNAGGYDINLTPGGTANYFGGTLSITGDMAGFILMTGEGHLLMDGATVSIPNARTFTNFVQATGPGTISMTSMTFTGTGAGAGSTGRQFLLDRFPTLQLSGTTLPGATVGLYNGTPLAIEVGGTNDTGSVWPTFVPALSCGTATFTVNSAVSKTLGKTVWLTIDYNITAIGTCTQVTSMTLPFTPQTGSGMGGRESALNGISIGATISAASATASITKNANAAWLVNERVQLSGVYQRQ